MKASVSILAAVCWLAAVLPAGAQTCATHYIVRTGDNLFRIGLSTGLPWPDLAAANNLSDPNLIYVGQSLCIPPTAQGTPTATGPTPARTATPTPSDPATATPTSATTATPTSPTPAPTSTPSPAPTTTAAFPAFGIVSVTRGVSVTIRTENFPPDMAFRALMGPFGTLGVNGARAGLLYSGQGGTFTATLSIPPALRNTAQIAVRLESASGLFSYNWFYNNTVP